MTRITNKQQMYRHLARGDFGNTTPQYFSVEDWWDRRGQSPFWGIRSLVPGGPCQLNVPTNDVAMTAMRYKTPFNISMMVDQVAVVTAWLEIWQSTSGLTVYGVEYPERGTSWRDRMPRYGTQWLGLTARLMLTKHLNPNSLHDLCQLLDRYPDHVVELSTLETCLGMLPHRNAIIWEVRDY